MTETTTSSSSSAVKSARLEAVTTTPPSDESAELDKAQREAIAQMVRQAKDAGVALTGPDGLLKALTAQVVEAALDEELNEHLGYDKHDPVGRGSGNSRNGTRSKTVITDNVGAIDIQVPRDRNGTFEPQLVKKRQRRLSDMDAMVLSLFAKGLTTGEIAAHFAEVYGTSVSKDTISRITDRVVDEMTTWMTRPLEPIYAAVFINAIVIKVRDGQVRNQPYYAAIGVDLEGHKDILGIWPGNGDGESAKFWFACLTELKNGSAEGLVDLRVYAASVAVGFMMSSNSTGVSFPSRRWRRLRCYFPSIQDTMANRNSSRVAQVRRSRTFFWSSAKNDSIAALSAHAPTRPMEPVRRCRFKVFRKRLERN